jgi:hypothetical protein
VALFAFGACQSTVGPRQTATGVVLTADGPNVTDVDRFSIRTPDGQTLAFEIEMLEVANGGKPAPHLREHLVSGVPIAVDYIAQNGRNLALRYVDAP